MSARLLVSHLAAALLAFGLGWGLSHSQTDARKITREATRDPAAAFANALQIEDPRARAEALAQFFEVADPAWATLLHGEVTREGTPLVLDEISETLFASWWAQADPEEAFANRVEPAWADRHPWLRQVMHEWLRRDPTSAIAAVETLPPDTALGRFEALHVLTSEWFEQEIVVDPTPLFALIRVLEPKARAGAITSLLKGSIKNRGLDATEQYVASLPKDDSAGVSVQQELMSRMGVVLLDIDVDRAVRWVEKHGQGRDGSGLPIHLAFYWGLKDGAAAMAWAMSLPDSSQRPKIIERAFHSFALAQKDVAQEWLLAQDPDGPLEGVYARALRQIAATDPERALEIAGAAKDSDRRQRFLAIIGGVWMNTDRDAAEAWLKGANLPPELVQRVRAAAPPRPKSANPS